MIRVLPESVANQIAAGEVIQRPASVVKELVENAVDAGSTSINVLVKDAGRTLIQIIDNGSGMSETDARISFERHATSKIQNADDLFAIKTFGFRGEALASVASIAEVELKTRQTSDEFGTHICINASAVVSQNPVACPVGSSFSVKNLFFNVPARRKFLKSDSVELKHIVTEFQRIALGHPEVSFTLSNNGNEIYNLPKGNLRQRIVGLFGKNTGNQLIELGVQTGVINIRGFIGKPEQAKRAQGEQFFYVNNRFFKSAYFHKALLNAYDQLIPQAYFPSFFLFMELSPDKIDVNIHPTKVEVKFEEEQPIWQVLNAAVREAIGKFTLAPTIDFNTEGAIDIPVMHSRDDVNPPYVSVDGTYNPFNEEKDANNSYSNSFDKRPVPQGWQKLYEGLDGFVSAFESDSERGESLFANGIVQERTFVQMKGEYIITPVKSGLMVIDQQRAHRRILFERFLQEFDHAEEASQTELFSQQIELNSADYSLLEGLLDELQRMGFDIRSIGKNSVVVYALPSGIEVKDPAKIVQQLIADIREERGISIEKRHEQMAISLAKVSAIASGRVLKYEEMSELVGKLFACKMPNVCPDGKPTLITIGVDEMAKRFLKK